MPEQFALSVVCPCLNEEANLALLAERLFASTKPAGITTELVVVDDGSTDGTADVVENLKLEYGDAVQCVRHDENRGIPASWRSGVDAARGDYVCFIDGDLQNPPEEVVTLYVRLLESAADLAQGTGRASGDSATRCLLLSRLLNFLLNLVFGMPRRTASRDSSLGPKSVVDDVITHRGKYRHFQTFISVAAHAKGYSILEVETLFESRYAGESFLAGRSLGTSLDPLADFARDARVPPRRPPQAQQGRRCGARPARAEQASVPRWRRALVRDLLRDHAVARAGSSGVPRATST